MNAEYRRGLTFDAWQRLWHFDEVCPDYPLRNFAIRKDRPSDDDLCARCSRAKDR